MNSKAFDPKKWQKLESDERRSKMPPTLLAEVLSLGGGDVVADIGAGTGYFAEVIALKCGKVIAVDHSEDMLQVFRDKESFPSLNNVELKVAKADKLPIESSYCDIAIHVNLLHEVDDISKFHQEIKRILKPGGKIFCVDWKAIETKSGPPLKIRVSEDMAIKKLEEDGFKNIKTYDIYREQYVIEAIS